MAISASNSTQLAAPASSSYKYTLSTSFTETGTSTTNNTSTISCSASIGASKISYGVSGGGTLAVYWHDNNQNTDRLVSSITVDKCGNGGGNNYGTKTASGSITVSHKSDGTLSGYAKAVFTKNKTNSYIPASGNVSTANTTLTRIPRQANLNSAPNFTDIQNPTITYTNSAGNSVTTLQACISLNGNAADIAYRNINKTGTSYTFNLTEAERNVLRNATTTSKTRNVIFYVKTVLGGVTYYSTLTRTLTITDANPTMDSLTYSDTNGTTTALTGDNQIIIQNKSMLQFQLGSLSAKKGATLSKVTFNINGAIQTQNLSGTTAAAFNFDYGLVNVSNNINASVIVYDSRGYTTTYTKSLTVWEYSVPTAIITLNREANFYTESNIKVDANYSSLDNLNTIDIKYRIKKSGDTTWGNWSNLSDNVEAQFNADNQYAWDIQVQLEDALATISTYTLNSGLDVGIPLLFYDLKRRSVGVNTIPTANGSFEIEGTPIVNGTDYTDTGWINITPTKGTWNHLRVRRIGKIVYIDGDASSYAWSGSAENFGTIPEGFRPSSHTYTYSFSTVHTLGRIYITTAGTLGFDWVININNGANYTTATWIRFKHSYFID